MKSAILLSHGLRALLLASAFPLTQISGSGVAGAGEICAVHQLDGQTRSADTVKRLDRAWGQAWDRGDVPFLGCLYDADWHYVDAAGITTKSQDIALAVKHHTEHPAGTRQYNHVIELRAFVIGNFAVATGLARYQAPGKKMSRSRWSDAFQWDGREWHAVFSQGTPVQ